MVPGKLDLVQLVAFLQTAWRHIMDGNKEANTNTDFSPLLVLSPTTEARIAWIQATDSREIVINA